MRVVTVYSLVFRCDVTEAEPAHISGYQSLAEFFRKCPRVTPRVSYRNLRSLDSQFSLRPDRQGRLRAKLIICITSRGHSAHSQEETEAGAEAARHRSEAGQSS